MHKNRSVIFFTLKQEVRKFNSAGFFTFVLAIIFENVKRIVKLVSHKYYLEFKPRSHTFLCLFCCFLCFNFRNVIGMLFLKKSVIVHEVNHLQSVLLKMHKKVQSFRIYVIYVFISWCWSFKSAIKNSLRN